MSSSARPILAFGLGAALLAGCGETQHPFQPDSKPLPYALSSPEAESKVIAVAPIKGVPEPLGYALAEAMAAALLKRSLPAVVESGDDDGRALYTVGGRLTRQAGGAGEAPAIIWEVREEHGRLVGRHVQTLPPGSDASAPEARAKLLAELGGEPAATMAKGIEGDAPVPVERALAPAGGVPVPAGGAPAARARDGSRTVVVTKVEGAPGDRGDFTLRQAIVYALKQARLQVVPERTANSLVVVGNVELAELEGGTQRVKVTWTVARSDGEELGQVSQENNVPSRLLSLAWGEIASAVAENAAGGIAALVRRDGAGPAATGDPGAR